MPTFSEESKPAMTEAAEAHQDRYLNAMHAMQSGVAFLIEQRDSESSPKHLRVGVNSALISQAAFAQLMMDKGVFTLEEYMASQADAAEREAKSHEDRIETEKEL